MDIGGLAQLPGSLLVPTAPSTTTLSGAGTNGRVLVAGDLVHTGVGSQLHSYPFLPDDDLGCKPPAVRLGTLTVATELDDPAGVVAPDRVFQGRFECQLDGDDVTPARNAWRARANASEVVISDQLPVGAVCTLTESLDVGPLGGGNDWAVPVVKPERLVVAKREVRGFTVSNKVLPPVPDEPTTTPTPTPTPDAPVATPATSEPDPGAQARRRSRRRRRAPSRRAGRSQPVPSPATDHGSPRSPLPRRRRRRARARDGPDAGPVTTTAPFTLRGAFVWGPLLMLSLLTLLLAGPVSARRRRGAAALNPSWRGRSKSSAATRPSTSTAAGSNIVVAIASLKLSSTAAGIGPPPPSRPSYDGSPSAASRASMSTAIAAEPRTAPTWRVAL